MIKDGGIESPNSTTSHTQLKISIQNDVMPHPGTLFGLTEDATSIILVEMGCLSECQRGRTTITCLQVLGQPRVRV